ELVRGSDSLNCATALDLATAHVNGQPCGLGKEAVFHADLVHQPLAAAEIGQALEDIGVDFVAKAEVFRFRMIRQQFLLPRQQAIAGRDQYRNRSATTQIELHPEAFEVADAHRTMAESSAEKCLET